MMFETRKILYSPCGSERLIQEWSKWKNRNARKTKATVIYLDGKCKNSMVTKWFSGKLEVGKIYFDKMCDYRYLVLSVDGEEV